MSNSTFYKECKTCSKSAHCWSFGGPYGFRNRFFKCSSCSGLLFKKSDDVYLETRAPACQPMHALAKKGYWSLERGNYVGRKLCAYCRADDEARKNGTFS
jgi:phage FluMu protein Com